MVKPFTPQNQLEILGNLPHSFVKHIQKDGTNNEQSKQAVVSQKKGLVAESIRVFQINVGKTCNQACTHCHVDASPARTEAMSLATANRCIEIVSKLPEVEVVDITGGAPEINQHFRHLVKNFTALNKHVIDRCNLTILEEPGYEYLYSFLAEHKVEIIASLPHYASARTDEQRGKGVFDKSLIALKKLNELGYGKSDSDLSLHLVYNPSGLFLSASQQQLQREFKEKLKSLHNVEFHNLYCINNMPISRFLHHLLIKDRLVDYMETLVQSYNPHTLKGLMCRSQISIGYEGSIYDCDFNQMLEIKANPISHIDDWNLQDEKFINQVRKRSIAVANHCFGCTAGAGSSCGGEVM